MDESADALADQQHLFSYAGKVCDLHSGHEDMIGLNSDVSEAYDRISPNEEQVCIPYYDIDTKWRSVTVGNPSQLFNKYDRMSNDGQFIECGVHVGNTECQKRILEICKIEVNPTNDCTTADKYDNGCSQKLSQAIKVPEEPFLLFLSHFETCVPFSRVSDLVERTFEQFPEISYEFVAEECMGDGMAFRAVFNELKITIQAAYVGAKGPECMAINCPQPLHYLPEIDSQEALKSVLLMAKSGKFESQLEASRLICDLSLHDDMQQPLCDSGCIQSLVEDLLPIKNCEWTHQHALIALANLSDVQSCQGAMIDAGVLPALLALAADGPYHCAEVSRESARILANLSSRMATRVVHVLGPGAVMNWIGSVDMLRDERLKLHATRAKEFLVVAAV